MQTIKQLYGQLTSERRQVQLQLKQIDEAISSLKTLVDSNGNKRHTMSKAGRERIAAAQRKRWAKVHKAGVKKATPSKQTTTAVPQAVAA